eukprot:11069508-Alexandrium_andersonii.AAC.1
MNRWRRGSSLIPSWIGPPSPAPYDRRLHGRARLPLSSCACSDPPSFCLAIRCIHKLAIARAIASL